MGLCEAPKFLEPHGELLPTLTSYVVGIEERGSAWRRF
jgi:hypothetical protein